MLTPDWIFITDPQFRPKAQRVLDLYARYAAMVHTTRKSPPPPRQRDQPQKDLRSSTTLDGI
ncbi:hypothetical protein ACSNOB_23090 [Micromonospora sp. URMC 106]|uniref:hypothetical protein n=1 Tax=Micromonospora sp. URMC 106 TaxID=3423408 RepID=UPI003F19F8E1